MKGLLLLVILAVSITTVRTAYCSIACDRPYGTECAINCPDGESANCWCQGAQAICKCKGSISQNATTSCSSGNLSCSQQGGPCKTHRDCCYQCTGVTCYSGTCQANTCLGRGSACDADCQCCSSNCWKSETSPGICK